MFNSCRLFYTINRKIRPSDIRVRTPYNSKPSHKTSYGRHLLQLSKVYFPKSFNKKEKLDNASISNDEYNSENFTKISQDLLIPELKDVFSSTIKKNSQLEIINQQALLKINNNKNKIESSFRKDNKLEGNVLNKTEILPALLDPNFQELKKKKNLVHKKLWNSLKRQNWSEWQKIIKEFKLSQLPPDEVSYTLLLHGMLISRSHNSNEAKLILNEMKNIKVHPALIHLNETLLNFYFSMEEFGININHNQWRSTIRSSWLLAALIKGRRERFLARKIEYMKKKGIEDFLIDINNLDTSAFQNFLEE